MHLSAVALPPQQPPISYHERQDPDYPAYNRYRIAMNSLLVEADSFSAWKRQRESSRERLKAMAHPRFREFQAWMRRTQGGARPCPAGVFPANFQYWLAGGRW